MKTYYRLYHPLYKIKYTGGSIIVDIATFTPQFLNSRVRATTRENSAVSAVFLVDNFTTRHFLTIQLLLQVFLNKIQANKIKNNANHIH